MRRVAAGDWLSAGMRAEVIPSYFAMSLATGVLVWAIPPTLEDSAAFVSSVSGE